MRPFPGPSSAPARAPSPSAAFVLLLAVAPFVPTAGATTAPCGPRATEPRASCRPPPRAGAGDARDAGRDRPGRRRGPRPGPHLGAARRPDRLAAGLVRCAEFEGQRYCLGPGWTTDTEAQVQARIAAAARTRRRPSYADRVDRRPRRARQPAAHGRAQPRRPGGGRARRADRGRPLGGQGLAAAPPDPGRALPAGFLARHPEAQRPRRRTAPAAAADADARAEKRFRRLPRARHRAEAEPGRRAGADLLVRPDHHADDRLGLELRARSQAYWAGRLGTTTGGSAISDMVRVVNDSTGYDRSSRAGTYITLDIGDYGFTRSGRCC